MICTLDIAINAAKPNIPLPPLKAFVGSPSSIRIRNVPKKIGKWDLTAVSVTANYPNNVTKTAAAVLTAGIWVATIPASAAAGISLNGYQITASGTDENGSSVSGYILGCGDIEIITRENAITPTTVCYKGDKGDRGPAGGQLVLVEGEEGVYEYLPGSVSTTDLAAALETITPENVTLTNLVTALKGA